MNVDYEDCIRDKIWITDSGNIVDVSEMSNIHIDRTIEKIKRDMPEYGNHAPFLLRMFEAEKQSRIERDFK